MPNFPIVDSHVHLYDIGRFRYGWLDSAPKLKRTSLSQDFDRARGRVEVDKIVFAEVCDRSGPAPRRGGLHPRTGRQGSLAFAAWWPMRRSKKARRSRPISLALKKHRILCGIRRLIETERDPSILPRAWLHRRR